MVSFHKCGKANKSRLQIFSVQFAYRYMHTTGVMPPEGEGLRLVPLRRHARMRVAVVDPAPIRITRKLKQRPMITKQTHELKSKTQLLLKKHFLEVITCALLGAIFG